MLFWVASLDFFFLSISIVANRKRFGKLFPKFPHLQEDNDERNLQFLEK
jgi:hypothetical protein